MWLIALKLVVVPFLVVGISIAERRWGPRTAGLLTSLPVISGPALFFFAIEQGAPFAAEAAKTVLITAVAVAAAAVAYARLSVATSWWTSLIASCLTFGVAIELLERLPWAVMPAAVVAFLGIGLARAALPAHSGSIEEALRPAWDLSLRAVSAAALVLAVTALAHRLGSSVSGMLAALPIALWVVVVFTHVQQGASAAAAFLGTFILGMWSSAAFSSTIALAIVPLGTRLSFPIAIGVTVTVQTIVLCTLSMASRRGCDAQSRHVCGRPS